MRNAECGLGNVPPLLLRPSAPLPPRAKQLPEKQHESQHGRHHQPIEQVVDPCPEGDVDPAEEAPIGEHEAPALLPQLGEGRGRFSLAQHSDKGAPAEQIAVELDIAAVPPARNQHDRHGHEGELGERTKKSEKKLGLRIVDCGLRIADWLTG